MGLIEEEPPSEVSAIRIASKGKETKCESSRRELGTGNPKGVESRFEEFGATFAVRTGVGGADFEVAVLLSGIVSKRV